MRIIAVLSIIILLFVRCESKNESAPNIIYINIDDLGWADISYNGSSFFETPNIDQLAQEGMVFTNAYAPSANCAPSRACCQTGLNTPRHGIYTVDNSDRGKAKDRKLIPTRNVKTLDDSFTTIAEVLKQKGYKTCHAGKWHLTDDPCTQGYDVNIAGNHWGNPSKGGKYFGPFDFPNLPAGDSTDYLSDLIMDEVLKFVDSNKDAPFYLYYSPYLVHTPLEAKQKLIEKYQEKEKSVNKENDVYAAMVEIMDYNVGRLLTKLNELDLAENTLILFTSDNGGSYKVSRQKPLRAGKGSYYEGGIREPFIVKWTGKVKAGSSNNTPVSGLDILPTFAEMANVPLDENIPYDGLSLLGELTQTSEIEERPLFWHFPIYLEKGNEDCQDVKFRTRPGSAIRYGDWKLIQYFENNDIELYNLKDDFSEKSNLASSNPEKVSELLHLLNNWRMEVKAPVPLELNPKYKD